MPRSGGWDPATRLARLKVTPWKGRAWRTHRRKYAGTDHGGSLLVSGRYNRGSDQFADDETWPALYLALQPETAIGEIVRHIAPDSIGRLKDLRLSEIDVRLEAVIDCRDAVALGLTADDLIQDYDFHLAQELAAGVIARGAEGIIVRSATDLGDNLIVFPHCLRSRSNLKVVGSRDPKLYVKR